ncbi:hypothetical protein VB715_04250 [Crocosphaera sp. UHCC 0190]|nr:hypothetical protein [Crocosphaera sp. UHCC 0190]
MTIQKFGYVIEEYTKWRFHENEVQHCTGFKTKSDAQEALEERIKFIIDSDNLSYRDTKIFSYEDLDAN